MIDDPTLLPRATRQIVDERVRRAEEARLARSVRRHRRARRLGPMTERFDL